MNAANILEFSVPLEGMDSQLTFIHYSERFEADTTIHLDFPEFTGLVLSLSSTIEYSLNETICQITPNRYQLIHTEIGSCSLTLKQGPHNTILIRFPPDILDSITSIKIFDDLLSAIRTGTTYQLYRPLKLPYQVHTILDQMYKHSNSSKWEAFMHIKVMEMFLVLIDKLAAPQKANNSTDEYFLTIDRARNIMIGQIDRNWSLDLLADTVGISRKKLIAGFRKYFETSPIKYLYDERLNLAVALLRDTNLSINQIAVKVGYRHSQNFSQAFSRKFGHPPITRRPY